MNLKKKREQISKEIRRKHLEDYFKKVRMSLQQNQTQNNNISPQQISKIGSNQILEVIQCYQKQRQSLNFAIINECAISSDKPWNSSVCFELANIVLQSFRSNGYAIASLSHALAKYQYAPFLKDISNLNGKVMQLLNENIEENKIRNGEAIAYLIYNLLFLSQNKEDFYFLPKYYQLFANSYGYFNRSLVLLLNLASNCRQLLPQITFVQGMLRSEINYKNIQPLDFKAICQFIQNFVCFDLNIDLYIDFVNWIERRLKEKKFPLSLKTTLIKILTMAFCYDCVAQYTNQHQDINFGVMQEIILIARFGAPQSKVEAIVCLCQFIRILQAQKVKMYVQNTQTFEVIVISLQLGLQNEQYCRLLQVLAIIFCIDEKYVKFAQRMGILPLLDRLYSSKSVQVANYARQTLQVMHGYN